MAAKGPPIRGWAAATYFVPDVRAARDWMASWLGRPPAVDDASLCQFTVGAGRITLHPADEKAAPGAGGQVTYWALASLDAMAAMMEWFASHGGRTLRKPVSGLEGGWVCQLLDPFGNVWGFWAPAPAAVEAATSADRAWLADLWRREWGGEAQESHGASRHVSEVDALVAWRGGSRVGAATFVVAGGVAELVTLNAEPRGQGIGSQLLAAWEQRMAAAGVGRLTLITTNDNLDALGFYQRRGYRLVRLLPGAVERARLLKPAIPLWGEHGIFLSDELVLEKRLGGGEDRW